MTEDHRLHYHAKDDNGDGDSNGDAIANEIIGYTDSVWANDCTDRESQGGHVFLCNGGAISWQSRIQDLVAFSKTEAE